MAMMDGNQAAQFTEGQEGTLPGELGIAWDEVATGRASGRFVVQRRHMASNGFLHAASVIALADTACGYACVASLPEGASGFTTVELKANYLGTAKEGETVACTARLVHGGPAPPPENPGDLAVGRSDHGRLSAHRRATASPLTSTNPSQRSGKDNPGPVEPRPPGRQPGYRHTQH